ncbi:DNA primase [uncultured Flavobacterium sp.]|uniref:DNA primase n=1 Tax=uncultured Flavobacterium sp. TaxID=165435 RepID=UPI0030CA12E7
MNRIIVDYTKLTHEILNLLVEKFPDGYDDSNTIRFRNAQNELIEAVEVKTEDTVFLVKISTNLADRIENYDEDDEIASEIEPIIPAKGFDDSEDDDDFDKPYTDNDNDDDDDDDDNSDEKEFDDDEDEDEDDN